MIFGGSPEIREDCERISSEFPARNSSPNSGACRPETGSIMTYYRLAIGTLLVALLTAGASAAPSKLYACTTAKSKTMGFCDPSKDFNSRVADLLKRLTTDEKISLMGAHGNDICAFQDGGVPRLDIPSYTWCVETNTGVSTACIQEDKCATTFPSPAALAATFNRSLWRLKGTTQSTEQRALFNLGAVRRQGSPIGLNVCAACSSNLLWALFVTHDSHALPYCWQGWGPNINTVRGLLLTHSYSSLVKAVIERPFVLAGDRSKVWSQL